MLSAHVGEVLAAIDQTSEPGEVPDLLMFSALIGVLMPPFVAIVNQPRWPSWARVLVVVLSSCAVGVATAALEGKLTSDRWVTSALIAGTAAVAAYRTMWRRTATAIEYKTSGEQTPVAP